MIVKKSIIQNGQADLSVSAPIQIRQPVVVGYYHGSLVYHDLSSRQNNTLTYGERHK